MRNVAIHRYHTMDAPEGPTISCPQSMRKFRLAPGGARSVARRYAIGCAKLLGTIAIGALISVVQAEPAPLAFDQEQRVRSGEIFIENIRSQSGVEGLRATFQVKAPPRSVWNILVDYKHYREVFTDVEGLDVLDEDERGARVRFRIKASWMSFEYTLQRDYLEPGRLLTWHRVDGDFKELTGQWTIKDGFDADHSLVSCESFVDIGFLVPTTFVRNAASREMDRTMRRMRERAEKYSASSADFSP
jgi:ribosome-associated toxin RatA of RatAB toxin-antitoxin module